MSARYSLEADQEGFFSLGNSEYQKQKHEHYIFIFSQFSTLEFSFAYLLAAKWPGTLNYLSCFPYGTVYLIFDDMRCVLCQNFTWTKIIF